jgi:hypothetical protein
MLLMLRTKMGQTIGTIMYWSIIITIAIVFCGVVTLDIYTWHLWSQTKNALVTALLQRTPLSND